MKYATILGTGSALPDRVLTNADLEKKIDTTDEWIMQRVGIRERRIVQGTEETTMTLALRAAKQAIEAAGITADALDLIIVGTATGDCLFPSVACLVQAELGCSHACPAFDLNAACSGFVYGLDVANQYIRAGGAQHVLVIGADALSQLVDWEDRSTCVLFGDGAGAVVLGASDQPGILHSKIHASGKSAAHLLAKSPIWQSAGAPIQMTMNGKEVFKLAVHKLEEIVDQTLSEAGMNQSDIDWLIPHQANMRIIQATAKRLSLPMSQVILTIERHGNTSAASVPIALDYGVRSGQIKRGQTLMLEAFGAGFAWGASIVRF